MLIYTGGGFGGFFPGIPARDLTDAEEKQFDGEMLVASGIYVRPSAAKIDPPKPKSASASSDQPTKPE